MTQDEIIQMAREAGFEVVDGQLRLYFDGSKALLKPNYMGTIVDGLKEFATIVAAHEREKLAEQEPFDMDDHPPHRLCECRKCMEYFTPLPDCDAFAASGKPIAEQTNTQFMKGFRPVSEMVAEHKQDPKKSAAIEKAKMRKAEQKPVAIMSPNKANIVGINTPYANIGTDDWIKLYAAPVRTKDLTDDEIWEILETHPADIITAIRAVIAADREKNNANNNS